MSSFVNDGFPFLGRDAQRLGYSRYEFRRARENRAIRMLFKYVYVDQLVPDSRWLRVTAAKLVTPSHAVVSDTFASWLHGVETFKPSDRHTLVPTLVVPHGLTRATIPGLRCRQAILPATDIVEIDGLLVTTAVRTTSDLLRKLWRPYALAGADGMARGGLVKVPEVIDYVAALRGFPGIRQARSLAPMIDPLAQTPGESWQRLRLLDAGFPRPTAQFEVTMPDGTKRYLDLAYAELLVAMEFDGREFHTLESDRAHDASRRNLLSDLWGWRWAVCTRDGVFGDDPAFEREVGGFIGVQPLLPRLW